MFCSHCGKELNNEAVVCPHCGVPTVGSGFDKSATGYQPYQGYQQPVNNGMPNRYTQGYQNPYQQPVQPPQPKAYNVCGIVGFVLALVSLFTGQYFCLTCIAGLILSIIGMVNRKKSNSCNGLAIAGLVISIISLVFWLLIWLIVGSLYLSYIFGYIY